MKGVLEQPYSTTRRQIIHGTVLRLLPEEEIPPGRRPERDAYATVEVQEPPGHLRLPLCGGGAAAH